MEPSPPASRKPKNLPFYQTPENVNTISDVIRDAKASLARDKLRPIKTTRPDTPQDGQRNLFGDLSTRDPSNRPPSAFSLGSKHFDSDSRPPSGIRLKPLQHKPQVLSLDQDSQGITPKPPADPNRPVKRSSSRTRLLVQSTSVDESEQTSHANATVLKNEQPRRVHSGPRERTTQQLEERGEGDGSETLPRTDSRSGRHKEGEPAESSYVSDTRDGSAGSLRKNRTGSGSAGRRDEESAEESLFYNTQVGPIVDEMASHLKDRDPGRLIELVEKLYNVLESGNMLGRACKRRSTILKTVYKLLDVDNPKLLLSLASLILSLKVSGNNLTNVCKLIFKVSKDENNDANFTEGSILGNILDTVKSTDPLLNIEALTYCVGAVKFLTGNQSLVQALIKLNCMEALASLLSTINKINSENGKTSDQLSNILVQLSGSLRNLTDISSTRSQFINNNIINSLCKVMETYPTDSDLMLNISRVFSKLTLHTDCCNAVSKQAVHFKYFMNVLKTHCKKEGVVLRVSFILGNLTAKNDNARVLLYQQNKCLETLLSVFKYYFEKEAKLQKKEKDDSMAPNKVEDVLIKVIRVVANLSINEEIGPSIASSETCVKLLLQILECKDINSSEELVLNTMATINNLSYYNVKNSAITSKQLQVAESLLKYLQVENMEGLTEATRVFGNLSREKPVREFLAKSKVLEIMIALLDSGSRDVVYTSVGVLINLMADEENRPILKQDSGVKKLTDVLRDFCREDWTLASMVCQTLWNYSGRITSTNSCFGEKEATDLVEILEEYLDEECALDFGQSLELEEEVRDLLEYKWKNEFYPVASRLLERIEKYQSDFESLEDPT